MGAPEIDQRLVLVKFTFNNVSYSRLRILNWADDELLMEIEASPLSGDVVVNLEAFDVRSIKIVLGKKGNQASGSVGASMAVYRAADTPKELGAFTHGGMADCRDNYWGVFPDVLAAIELAEADVDVSGFEAVPISGTGPQ